MLCVRVVVVHNLVSTSIIGREAVFEVTTIRYVVGFVVVSIEHMRFRVSSSSSATLRVEVVRKRVKSGINGR